MSRIDDLIAELCPEGVKYQELGKLVTRTSNISWVSNEEQAYQYIDLTSVDRITHQIQNTELITAENAPSRAQQIVREGDVLFGTTRPMLKRFCHVPTEFDGQIASTGYCVLRADASRLLSRFLFHLLGTSEFYMYVEANQRGASYPAIPDSVVKDFRIPLPPMEVQREIVRILDTFRTLEAELEAELEARRIQYAHYRDHLLEFGDEVEWVPLCQRCRNLDSQRRPVTKSARQPGEIPYYGASGIVDYVSDYILDGDYLLVSEDGANLLARSTPIAFPASGRIWVNNHAHVLEFDSYAEQRFVDIYLNSIDLAQYVSGGAQPKLNQTNLNRIPIPTPPLPEQERIVSILDSFDALVSDLSVGLPGELVARRKQYEHYRDRLLTFEEAPA